MRNSIEKSSAGAIETIVRRALTELVHKARRAVVHAQGDPGGLGPDSYDDRIKQARERLDLVTRIRGEFEKIDDVG